MKIDYPLALPRTRKNSLGPPTIVARARKQSRSNSPATEFRLPLVRLVLGKEFYQMFRWFNHAGLMADINGLRRRYPEVRLRSLEEWSRDEGWHKRARRVRPPRE